jgi:hypothetical protein
MSQQKLTRKQLEPMIGTRTRVAEVLNRRPRGVVSACGGFPDGGNRFKVRMVMIK